MRQFTQEHILLLYNKAGNMACLKLSFVVGSQITQCKKLIY